MYQNVKIMKHHYLKNYTIDLNKIGFKWTGYLKNPELSNFIEIERVVQKLWKETCFEDCLISLMFLRDDWTDFYEISVKWKV